MIWKELLTATIRHLLGYAAVWLVAKGVIDEALAEQFLGEGAAAIAGWIISGLALLLPILWSYRDKIRKRIELMTALEQRSGTAEDINRMVSEVRPSSDAF